MYGPQIRQLETQVGRFTYSYEMVHLTASVDTTNDWVPTQVADGAVRRVHEAAELLPPVPAAAHWTGAR